MTLRAPQLLLLLLAVAALGGVPVACDGSAGSAGGSANFVNPAMDISSGSQPWANNPVWTEGDTQTLKWKSTFPQFVVEFWQQVGLHGANKGATIFSGTIETEFSWIVQTSGLSLDVSNVFFFFIFNPDDPKSVLYTPSGYFNITEADAAPPPSPATSKSSSSSPTTAASTPPPPSTSTTTSPSPDSSASLKSTSPSAGPDSPSSTSTSTGDPSKSPSTSNPPTPLSTSAPVTDDRHSSSSSSLSTGAKAGIAIGVLGVAAIASLLGAVLLASRRRKDGGAMQPADETSKPHLDSGWRKANAWAAGQPSAPLLTELESLRSATEMDALRNPAELEHAGTPMAELPGPYYAR